MKKKTWVLALALVLVVGLVIGGTLAWLVATAGPVVNTFSGSNINITLEESDDLDLQMIPGHTIIKDPEVTVEGGSEKAYLFVELVKSDNFDNFMSFEMAEGWEQGGGTNIPSNVYYRIVDSNADDRPFQVILNDKVEVKTSVDKDMMDGLNESNHPTLTVSAYATQFFENNTKSFTPEQAWGNAKPTVEP